MKQKEIYLQILSRISLFIVFFWFGIIKILSLSPAENLVKELYSVTIANLHILSLDHFVIFLGIIEVMIGILWLIPKLTKFSLIIFLLQMFTTFGPLIFLPAISWQSFLIPTLVGQYIIKNIVLVMLAFNIYNIYIREESSNGNIL
jgi:uncharacterized membrane protein YkgB